MDGEDEVIDYLSGEVTDHALDPLLAADLDDLNALLADPALWDDPAGDLRERVVLAVEAEVGASAAPPVAVVATADSAAPGRRSTPRKKRWAAWLGPGLIGAAAAGLIAFAVTRSTDDGSQRASDGTIELHGTDLLPQVSGKAEVTSLQSGLWIQFDVPGMPRREGDDFYQAWLRSADGKLLVPIGSFHEGDHVSLWAGVSIEDFPILTVTKETAAAPDSPDQGSSGEVVVRGQYDEP